MRAVAALVLAFVAVPLVLAVAYIPSAVIYAERFPVTRSPAEVGLAFENVELEPSDRAIRLAAWWMPAPSARSLLIFVHGGASNRHTSYFRALAFYRRMVDRNVSVLAFDLRNHGASDSDGQGMGFGASEKADLEAAVRWARARHPELPLFAMGISMGGAVAIHAALEDDRPDGIVLVDPLLDTASVFEKSVRAETGIPEWLLGPASWSAIELFGLPDGEAGALAKAKSLELPILLIQDPDDPVTVASHARELAAANPAIELWVAPAADPRHPALAWKKRWGSHVSAFELFPDQTVGRIMTFIERAGRR